MLPEGSIRIDEVWVDGEPYTDFDGDALTVNLPPDREVKVKARIVATASKFEIDYEFANGRSLLTLSGVLDSRALVAFR
ncbi:MAG: hypothetical protein QOE07_2690, partial [Acidimicrobiaceae bacterium]|nr:hypothetical protein [Acidimicrobiaceae bacterium]